MYTGPNIERDGLVFGYDTGYGVADNNSSTRFYPGESTTNVVTNRIPTTGWNTSDAQGSSITRTFLTENGIPFMRFSNVTNGSDYPRITDSAFYNSATVTGTFSTSLEVRGTVGASLRFRIYENGSTKITNTINLTSDWVRYTFDNQTTSFNLNQPYFNPVTTGATYDIRNIQIESKSHSTPFVNGTRSSTQSLIDLTKTTNIDVSNVSFDSTGQPTFDGTDDGIQISTGTNLSTYSSLTYEGIVKGAGIGDYDRWFSGTSGTTFHYPDLAIDSSGLLKYIYSSLGISWISTGVSITTSKYNHIVFTFENNGSVKLFVNGSSVYTASHTSGTFPSVSRFMVGSRYDRNGEAIVGQIPVIKIYNRALSAQEVLQNYRGYKNRFKL